MRSLLLQMAEDEDARQVCLLDDRFMVFLSTEERLIGTNFAHNEIIAAINAGKRYSRNVELDGEQLFQTFIPIARHGITAMVVTFSLDDIVQFRKNLFWYGMLVMVSMYLFVISLLFATHIKERRLRRMAYIDLTTGLPNRNFLIEYLDRNMKRNTEQERFLILIRYLNFEEIYASQGLSTREDLVSGIAHILQRIVLGDWAGEHGVLFGSRLLKNDRFDKKLFRYDDETFAIFTRDVVSENEMVRFVQMLDNSIADGITIAKERIIPIWAKYGIGRLERETSDPQILLQNILLALHKPEDGDVNYHFFTRAFAESQVRKDEVAQELQEAITTPGSPKLWLAYQPQFDLESGKLVGFESLARFNSTKYGFVPPNEFIAIAEEKHLIITLGEHILRRACTFSRELEDLGYPDIIVAVNISVVQLLRADFVEQVLDIVEEYGINKNALELEITETIFFEDFEKLNETIRRLAALGFSLALDDFGVGYSSLARLKELDFNIIKVDRLFTQKIMGKDPEHLIYPDIISMAHRLGLKVIAEGVEYLEQAEFLLKHRCDIVQGYLFGKPIPKHEAIELLLKSR
jgi:EAL domain-containing protein (putative c-di-GMP-specific phosphodiesterase class I)/GGDEF domain-containing protein